jgi:hypothetical protein
MAVKLRKNRRTRRDASESAFLQTQLEEIRAKVYEQRLPQFKARTLIPVNNNEDPGLEIIKYRTFDQVGSAKIISAYADDLPRADVYFTEATASVRSLGSSYGYNLQEVRASARSGQDLETRKANAARRAIEQEVERIAKLGDADNGLLGLLNQPNALIMTIPNGAGGSPLWANKTADEILTDLSNLANNSYNNTNQVEAANTILLPFSSYSLISRMRLVNTNTTVLQFFRQINSEADVQIARLTSWQDLETAGAGGTRRAVAYRNDPDALELRIPQEFEQLPEEKRNLEYVVDCHARMGGVLAFYPLTITYADGM